MKFFYLILAIVIFLLCSYLFYSYFQLGDDTYIYLQYAKHIINNHELSFNLGEKSYGFTGPFWLFLIVTGGVISNNLILVPALLSQLFSVLTVFAWYFIVLELDIKKTELLFSLMLIAVDPNLLKHSFLGMEASLSYLFSTTLILLLLSPSYIKHYLTVGVIIGLYHLTRPESAVFSFLILLWIYKNGDMSLIHFFKVIIVMVLTCLPWYLFAYFYFGTIFPNTFGAKGFDYSFGGHFFLNALDSMKIFFGNYLPYLLVLLFAIITTRKMTKLFLYSTAIIIFYVLFYSITMSNEYVYARYYSIVFPLINLIAIKTLCDLRLAIAPIIRTVVLFSILLLSIIYSKTGRAIYTEQESTENKIINWINTNTRANESIVRGRIGKIGYMTNRRIIDPVGLINPEISRYYKTNSVEDFYLLKKPDYFIGDYENIISNISRNAIITVEKEYSTDSNFLIRNMLNKDYKKQTLKIYKVLWY